MKLCNFLNQSNWCQGWYAEDEDGEKTYCTSSSAVRYSLMGALIKLYPDLHEYLSCQDRLASLIRILHGKRIEEFNDEASWSDIEFILNSIDM